MSGRDNHLMRAVLEEIRKFEKRMKRHPDAEDIALALGRPLLDVADAVDQLLMDGVIDYD